MDKKKFEQMLQSKEEEIQRLKNLCKEQINKIKELEDELYNYEFILASIPSHVYWLDSNNTYLGCNDAHAKTVGLKSRKDIIGKTNYDMPWKDQAELINAVNQEVIDTESSLKKEEFTKIDNVVRHYISEKSPLRNKENDIIGVLGISVEITELKNLEESLQQAKEKAEAANIAKSKFIANMSHDIRTPLTGIVGLSDILFDTVIKDESKEYAKMLHLSGEQLLSLLNSILDVVASDSIDQQTKIESAFNLHDLLDNIFELELPALKLKDLTLDLTIDEEIPSIVRTDKGKLYRILLNLLSNSIKFTEEGSISIEVNLLDKINDNLCLGFKIIDTGIGIPKTDMDKIFNPFYKVHPSYEGQYPGFGVGLHLVRQYIDILGGDISVKSFEGMGTVFSFKLDVKEANGADIDAALPLSSTKDVETVLEQIGEPDLPTISEDSDITHVLLVEDNPMAMKVADMLLAKLGCLNDKAFNSTDALNLFKEKAYDFVLTDIGLPDYSGFELAKKMIAFDKEHRPDSKPTPIIGLTAHAKQEALLQGNQCGMVEVCEKPLTAQIYLFRYVWQK